MSKRTHSGRSQERNTGGSSQGNKKPRDRPDIRKGREAERRAAERERRKSKTERKERENRKQIKVAQEQIKFKVAQEKQENERRAAREERLSNPLAVDEVVSSLQELRAAQR